MRSRRPLVAVALAAAAALPALALAQTQAPTDTGADFFRSAILKDAKTTSAVRRLLRTEAGFIDPASQYGDLTGDDKPDAVVRVDTGGAAGAIAVYVFTADGSKAGKLHIVYRNQGLHRVTAKVSETGTMTLSRPVWKRGDDVCCPRTLRQQDYVWDAKARTMRRDGPARDVTLS
jgi:hypothetical protein